MLRASGVSARITLDAVPLLPGAADCFARGLRSTAHAENEKSRRALRIGAEAASRPELAALFDPQTSGGLLIAIPADRADAALAELHATGDAAAACVGEATDPAGHLFAVDSENVTTAAR
jgi:selenide,water dikinase